MKRISKWLIPGFLRRWDGYLLENQPVVWRTRGHFVLFYGIPLCLLLFIIDTISLGSLSAANIFNFFTSIVSTFLFSYWGRTQYLFKINFYSFKNIIITFATYLFCVFFVLFLYLLMPYCLGFGLFPTWQNIIISIEKSILLCLLLLSAPFMSFRTVTGGIALLYTTSFVSILQQEVEKINEFFIIAISLFIIGAFTSLFFFKNKQTNFVLYMMYLSFIYSISITTIAISSIGKDENTQIVITLVVITLISEVAIFFILVLSYKTITLPKVK